MIEIIHIKAEITFLPQMGPRSRPQPLFSGYQPAFDFRNNKDYTSGKIIFLDREQMHPGETAIVKILFIKGQFDRYHLHVGDSFAFDEPPVKIGVGRILEIGVDNA